MVETSQRQSAESLDDVVRGSTKILMMSLLAPELGSNEGQLGNATLFTVTLQLLTEYLPGRTVRTNLQFSEAFQNKNQVESIHNPRFWKWRKAQTVSVLWDYARSWVWKLVRMLTGLDLRPLVLGHRLNQYCWADVILSINGDTCGDNLGRWMRLLRYAIEMRTARNLGKPVIEFAGSAGPFTGWKMRAIGRWYLSCVSLITSREVLSRSVLEELGLQVPVIDTACPAFLLPAGSKAQSEEILRREGIPMNGRLRVSLTLCGYNLPRQQTWDTPQSYADVSLYMPLIRQLIGSHGAHVVLVPHVHRWNHQARELTHGPEWLILRDLLGRAEREGLAEHVTLLDGVYGPCETKGMLGQMDLHISGRLHAGVAALSQCIPTVLISYGHKHRGFAQLLGIEDLVVPSGAADELVSAAERALEQSEAIRRKLSENLPRVQNLVRLNFEIVRDVVETVTEWGHVSQAQVAQWSERGS